MKFIFFLIGVLSATRAETTGAPVCAVRWNVRKQFKSLFDGHDALVGGENDSHVELWHFSIETAEVSHQSSKHFLRTCDMKTEIALCSVPNFFREMVTAVLTIRVRKEVKHVDFRDISECGEHLIESLSTFGLSE